MLQHLEVTGLPRKTPKILPVCWLFLNVGCIKVNSDGATLGAPGATGGRGVFVTSRDFVKRCFGIPLGNKYAFEAEL